MGLWQGTNVYRASSRLRTSKVVNSSPRTSVLGYRQNPIEIPNREP